MNGFAPLQSGIYASMGAAWLHGPAITGDDHQIAMMFRQVNGSVRLLTFRDADIDEYDSTFTRTNRKTGLSSTYSMWSAASWGNQIIACNLGNNTQSSTGAGFSDLGGSSPKARMVAANANFVMFADVDDGGSNVYADMVWWSGIRNPSTWTPSQATQAGRVRLLDVPGPIRALVAYREGFVAFKDNGIIVGQYIGPPYVFAWRVVSNRVGCVGQNAVVELDGKLYFLHSSGFWQFDGQSLTNIGLPVFQSFAVEAGYLNAFGSDYLRPSGRTPYGIGKTQAVADDAEGVVWFATGDHSGDDEFAYLYGYNTRSGKWSRTLEQVATTGPANVYQSPLVKASTSDLMAFGADPSNRFWTVRNDSSSYFMSYLYPAQATTDQLSFETGLWGDQEDAGKTLRVWLRHKYGTTNLSAAADVTSYLSIYRNEAKSVAPDVVTPTFNHELHSLDCTASGRYKKLLVNYALTKTILLGGVGLNQKMSGKR